MSDLNSRLNLVRAQQAQKETVINSLFNAMSAAAFGGKNETASNGLTWGIYGGSTGSVIIPNTTVTLTNNATQYLYFNYTTAKFELSTTAFGDFPCYLIVTSGGIVTDWKDYRPLGGSGSGGSKDPNFVSTGVPTVAPTSTGANGVAIGSGSVSSGSASVAIGGGEASATSSFAFGPSTKALTTYSISIGRSNRIESGSQSVILGGNANTLQNSGGNSSIINSVSSSVTSTANSFCSIINSNLSSIAGVSNNQIINGYNAKILANVSKATGFGNELYMTTTYSVQFAFTRYVKKQYSGLSANTTNDTETSLLLGDGFENIRTFKVENNQVVNLKVCLIGVDASFNCVKFETDVLVKCLSSASSFVGETSSTTKDLSLIVSDSSLSTTTARIAVNGQEVNVMVKGIASTNIRWSAIFDSQIVQRASL